MSSPANPSALSFRAEARRAAVEESLSSREREQPLSRDEKENQTRITRIPQKHADSPSVKESCYSRAAELPHKGILRNRRICGHLRQVFSERSGREIERQDPSTGTTAIPRYARNDGFPSEHGPRHAASPTR